MIPDAAGSLEDIVGDLAGALLDNDTPDDQEDTDLIVEGDIDAVGLDVLDVNADVLLDPVESIVGDVDVALDADIDLLNPDTNTTAEGGDDTDLVVDGDIDIAGTNILDVEADIPLDPVEAVVGDLDIELDAQADLIGSGEGTGEEIEDNTGEVSDAVNSALQTTADELDTIATELDDSLLNNPADETGNSDTDLTVDGDVDVLDSNVLDVAAEVILDPVEAIVGDIDADLDAGLDLINPGAETTGQDDEDLTVDTDLNIAGLDILDVDADINLDPVEAIVGDLDVSLDTETDLLNWGGDSTDGDIMSAIDNIDGTSESASGSDETASNDVETGSPEGLGELAFDQNESDSDASSEQGVNADDVLPDPSGTVLEGLSCLSVDEGISSLDGTFLG